MKGFSIKHPLLKYQRTWYVVAGCFVLLLVSACHSSKLLYYSEDAGIKNQWDDLYIDHRYHAGIAIYDLTHDKSVFGYRADNYFTPASNVKILTLYAALQLLGEQVPAGYYIRKPDSLIIWGGGDPGTNYPAVDSNGALVSFISEADRPVYFSNAHFQTQRYGQGWAWDDYTYPFQSERNAYPIYGNQLWIRRTGDQLFTKPAYLEPFVVLSQDTATSFVRKESGEQFDYHYDRNISDEVVHAPIGYLKNDIIRTWTEATGKDIQLIDRPFTTSSNIIAGSPRDSLIKIMMQESDNFIAEQLLLACALRKLGVMNEASIIDDVRHTYLSEVDDYFQWVDGSGLSRYNLLTPRSLVDVLQQIYTLKGMKYIEAIFPAGGKSGTIKEWYGDDASAPFVFAKSGGLRNNTGLSGYLVTKRGTVLVFSFLHNQFIEDTAVIKQSMEKLFYYLYDKY